MQHERDKRGHGGLRAGAGRPAAKLERLKIGAKASTRLRTMGAIIEDPELPDPKNLRDTREALACVPIGARKNPPADIMEHFEWLAVEKRRVVKAERPCRSEVFASVAAEESQRLGIPISERQVRRWYEELLPPRRG